VSFWGSSYVPLSAIKTKYNPPGVFWIGSGINADYFKVVNGRVCAAIPTISSGETPPLFDSQNYATDIDPNEDSLSNFSGTPTLPIDDCGMDSMERTKKSEVYSRVESDALYPLPAGFLEEPPLNPSNPAIPGATFAKIRYGPYTIKAMGELSQQIAFNAKMPCTSCYVTAIAAGLEYANGTSANIDTGPWLHHMVLYNNGFWKSDLVCGSLVPQRIFASGNEHTVSRINTGGKKFGLKFDATDTTGYLYDLMNTSEDQQTYYLTLLSSGLAMLHVIMLIFLCFLLDIRMAFSILISRLKLQNRKDGLVRCRWLWRLRPNPAIRLLRPHLSKLDINSQRNHASDRRPRPRRRIERDVLPKPPNQVRFLASVWTFPKRHLADADGWISWPDGSYFGYESVPELWNSQCGR
jgi:hypothetical protein